MSPTATLTLASHGLELRCGFANLREDRPLTETDAQRFEQWRAQHQALARAERPASAPLLALGEQVYDWINGPEQFLRRVLEYATAPLLIEIAVARQDNRVLARAFLDAPWELLAAEGRHWALAEDIVFCPVRRIGSALAPAAPSQNRLSLVFMAAAPRGADTLNYEAEESAILRATQHIGLDLAVEESGTLDLLGACVAREHPEVVQISCHGTLSPEPALQLEDDVGDEARVKSGDLARKLASHPPRLLFLSACETAQADPVLDSLARALVRAGPPAVLGWAAPVLDREATVFAAQLYARLAQGEDLAQSLAYVRLDLASSEELPVLAQGRSRDWHLARLYLGPNGGGALASADGPRKQLGRGQAVKAFLDAKGKQVPVAGEREFVGRRREIQTILRAFRAMGAERAAGVLIHGLGRQGKSSLAARVAQRLEATHELVVLYGRYDGAAILSAIRERVATAQVSEICQRYLPQVERDPTQLLPALTELLEGPCQQMRKKDDKLIARPLLLVLDDFEQALEPHPDGLHRVKPELIDAMRALVQAFNAADTESRLLFTSRYRFTLPRGTVDLAQRLKDLALHGMDEREARKQANAKLHEITTHPRQLAALQDRLERILEAAQGNPGLQELLFPLCLQDANACDRCLDEMKAYRDSGTLPQAEAMRAFLENLAIAALLNLLSAAERELLRSSLLFELPVPLAVMQALSEQPPAETELQRLIALGLWEVYEDLHQTETTAFSVNALVRSQAGSLRESEAQRMAKQVLPALLRCWDAGIRPRGALQDYEITRLALLAGAAEVLAESATGALRYLESSFDFRRAAEWAHRATTLLDDAGVEASVPLLRAAADRLRAVGEVTKADTLRQRALQAMERGVVVADFERGALVLDHARALAARGEFDAALPYFEAARSLLASERDRTVVLGDIADILSARGQLDEALRIRQEEQLPVYERLGDQDGIANALWSIARFELEQQKHQEAFAHLARSYEILLKLGRLDGICVVGLDLGRLLCAGGAREEGLAVLRRSEEGFRKLEWNAQAEQAGDLIRSFETT